MIKYILTLLGVVLFASEARSQEVQVLRLPEPVLDEVLVLMSAAPSDRSPAFLEFACVRSLGTQTFRVRFPEGGQRIAVRCPSRAELQEYFCTPPQEHNAPRAPVPRIRSDFICSFPENPLGWLPRQMNAEDLPEEWTLRHIIYTTDTNTDVKEAATR